MEKLIQYATKASFYNGEFGGSTGWIAAGMGYLIVTAEGKLIVIDGGNTEDAEGFWELIVKYSPRGEVDLWLLTHPHVDHYGALSGIMENKELSSRIKVKNLVSLFGTEADMPSDDTEAARRVMALDALDGIIDRLGYSPTVPFEGDTYTVDSAVLEIIALPKDLSRANASSMIFSVSTRDKKVLFTGDCTSDRLEDALERHGDKLKSDILQIPHHGLCDTGHIPFYEAVAAETILVPICRSGEAAMKSGIYGDATEPQLYAEKLAKSIYRSFDGTTELKL